MNRLRFTDEPQLLPCPFQWTDPELPYMRRLRTEYELERLVYGAADDLERVCRVVNWVHNLWVHDGLNVPERPYDPISILEAVRAGHRYRCVEYGMVIFGALNSLGIPTRPLALKTSDVETRESGAGHVVAEAYLRDQGRWVFVDGQFNAVALLDGQPLNAVELQEALSEERPGVNYAGMSPDLFDQYRTWLLPYLYYFDYRLDNRCTGEPRLPEILMLGPVGAPQPRVFQRDYPLENVTFTHSVRAFYPTPVW
ncbi:MAG: transglutaminase-like domain-containing protein [Bacillota bacterium]